MKKQIITYVIISITIGLSLSLIFSDNRNMHNISTAVFVSFLYTLVFGFGNKFLNDFLTQKYSWISETKKRTNYGIIGTLVVNIIITLGCNYINFILIYDRNSEHFFQGGMLLTHFITLNIALLISAVLHARGFMEAWKESAKHQVDEQKLIANTANAQFESLKNQLDPHFLFNSLNVLSSLIEENPPKATRFTKDLSKIYRYVLEQKDKKRVPVSEEIQFAKTYAELLKTRFEKSISFDFNIDENQHQMIIPLSLQLLLENVVKHNMATSTKTLNVKVYQSENHIVVENNLQPRNTIQRNGIGLENIKKRYELLTDQKVEIQKNNEIFCVKIPILKAQ